MPIGSQVIYNAGDLILSTVSSSGNTFVETKIAAATSSVILFNNSGSLTSASLSSLTVGNAISSSYALTASFSLNAGGGSGTVSGTTNYIAKFTSPTSVGTSSIYETGSNVGIGTTDPQYKLDVRPAGANARVGIMQYGSWPSGPTYAYMQHSGLNSLDSTTYAFLQESSGETFFNAATGQVIHFRIGNSEKAQINTSGYFGVGHNNNPILAKLEVSGSPGEYLFNVKSTSTPYTLFASGSGRVGIGTNVLPNKLTIDGNVTASSYTSSIVGAVGFLGTASYALNTFTSSYSTYTETSSLASFSQNAQDILLYVKNDSGQILQKGTVVRIVGVDNSSNVAKIQLADFSNEGNSANTLGFTNETFAINGFGYVMTEGLLTSVNTDGFTAGDLLYLSSSGTYTNVVPTPPNHGVRLGQAIRIQSSNGTIYVRVDNGAELDELHNVLDTSTTSSYGDLLVKSGSVWINSKNLTGSYAITGSLNVTQNVSCSVITSSFAYLSNIGFTNQTVASDTSVFPTGSVTGGFILDGGIYKNGLYRTRFVKIDRSANLPLYIQETQGSSGSFSNLARFGTHANSPNTFEVFGSTNIQGSLTSSNISSSNITTANITCSNITASGNIIASKITSSGILVNGNLTVTGSIFASLFSASYIYITSSTLVVTDNILTLNALSPYQRYAGIEMYDSGSGNLSSFLWDGQGDYFFVTGSGVNSKIIVGPDQQTNLTSGRLTKATGTNIIGDSIVSEDGNGITVSGYISGSSVMTANITCSNISASKTGSFGIVGIGTSSPASKLDVRNGYITAGTDTSTAGSLILAGYYTAGSLTTLGTEQASGGPVLAYAVYPSASVGTFRSSTSITISRSAYTQNGGNHRWFLGPSQTVAIGDQASLDEIMRLTTTGLGIGTTIPGSKLQINDSTPTLTLRADDGGVSRKAYIDFYTTFFNYPADVGARRTSTISTGFADGTYGTWGTEFMAFHVGSGSANDSALLPIERMRIDGSGNVGIGVKSPSGRLHITASATSGESLIYLSKGSGSISQNFITAVNEINQASYRVTSDINGYTQQTLYRNGTSYVYHDAYWSSWINNANYSQGGLNLGSSGLTHGYGLTIARPATSGSLYVSGSSVFTGSVGISGSINLSGPIIYDNAVLMDFGRTTTPAISTNYVVLQNITGSYNAAFFDYFASSASNFRAGTVIAGWSGSSINYTEYSTTDTGNTNQLTMSVDLSSSFVRLLTTVSTTTNWSVKTSGRYL